MSQVFIEFTQVASSSSGRDTPVASYNAVVEEITSSGSDQNTTATTTGIESRNIVTVMNNGADTIWVNFGAAAAVGTGRPVMPATERSFGNVPKDVAVHVINDS